MSERKLMATEEIVVEPQNHSNQQERSIMASSSEPIKHLEQLRLEMDQDQDAILAKAYPWGANHADIEIQAKWPGAPYLMRWTREQCSMGGTNSQLQHAANAASGQPSLYEFTSDECSLGGTNAQATHAASAKAGNVTLFGGNPHDLTFEDRSLGGTNSQATHDANALMGAPSRYEPGCGRGKRKAYAAKEETQANYLAYCASDAGKDNFANRDINTAPAHYRELFELNPPLYFMNAIGLNKARITLMNKQSKK
jgi:hypothetical protein